jgi:hypothetical protein
MLNLLKNGEGVLYCPKINLALTKKAKSLEKDFLEIK